MLPGTYRPGFNKFNLELYVEGYTLNTSDKTRVELTIPWGIRISLCSFIPSRPDRDSGAISTLLPRIVFSSVRNPIGIRIGSSNFP